MRILVVGSLHHLGREDRQKALPFFANVCRSIGAQISIRGHTLIVGTDSENCADLYFAEGAESSGAEVNMVVVRAQTGHRAFIGWEQRIAKLERKVTEPSSWFDARSYQVRNADLVMLIGGKTGTRGVFEQALFFGRPVVPLGYVGGTAEALFLEASVKSAISQSAAQLLRDRNEWNRGTSPQTVVQMAEQLVSKQPVVFQLGRYLRAIPTYGTRFAKLLWQSLKWLVVAILGAVVALAVKDYWPSISKLIETVFH
jgi:hypothetical protein